MSPDALSLLRDVDVFMFDVFGTTADWFTTISREAARRSGGMLRPDEGAADFAREWRQGYYAHIRNVNAGSDGSMNIDVVLREILDAMLASPRWSHLAAIWDDSARRQLVHLWHDLDLYDDTLPGLTALAQSALVVALSNGNYRLLVDMAKNKRLPWDGILSTEFFRVYKPTTHAYLSAAYHLGTQPHRIVMVAAHAWDLEGAARAGCKTVYVPRPAEDARDVNEAVRTKAQGGSFDLVVRDFEELAVLAAEARRQ